MSNLSKFTKAELIEFLKIEQAKTDKLRNRFFEVQHELDELKQADSETTETATGKLLDRLDPIILENSQAITYFWERLRLEASFGAIPKEIFELVQDTWEQSEADEATAKLEIYRNA